MKNMDFDYAASKDAIKDAMDKINIPFDLRGDAEQVGFMALVEGKSAYDEIKKWAAKEKTLRQRLTYVDPYELEDPESLARRLRNVRPRFRAQHIGDAIDMYEKK